MLKASIIGHFAEGMNKLNGQTVKTQIVFKELVNHFGKENIEKTDTHGGMKTLLKAPFLCVSALRKSENIIMMPAENGLRIFTPLLYALNLFYHRKMHYVVIGGWLPQFLQNKKILSAMLKTFSGIFVETPSMKRVMQDKGYRNVSVIPNCKELQILRSTDLVFNTTEPFKLCTFSRVMKEKGIEEAATAVENINTLYGRTVLSLDIYGQIDDSQVVWFTQLKDSFPPYICYKGVVSFDDTTSVLKNYFALLFPTFYEGEGFAGTLIDAMAAGIPVIASDWKYNSEIILHNITGRIIEKDIETELVAILENPEEWNKKKQDCLNEAHKYLPAVALLPLIESIR